MSAFNILVAALESRRRGTKAWFGETTLSLRSNAATQPTGLGFFPLARPSESVNR